MAIDNNAKKASLLNMATPWPTMGPLLDGAFSQGEHQHLLGLYSGILAAEDTAAEVTAKGQVTVVRQRERSFSIAEAPRSTRVAEQNRTRTIS